LANLSGLAREIIFLTNFPPYLKQPEDRCFIIAVLIEQKEPISLRWLPQSQHLFHLARHSLNQAVAKTQQNYPFTIEAWVLL